MKIEKRLKPSGTKSNSRYRGVTDLMQFSNFVLESAHDMNLLAHELTGNEPTGKLGHEKEIEDNYISLFNGGVNPASYSSFTASTICKVNRSRAVKVPALDTWEKVNGCTVTKSGTTYKLSSPGTLDPCGVRTGIFVFPGDIIYFRLKVSSTTNLDAFTFGSENINRGAGDLKKVNIIANSDGLYVDYRLYCTSQETIFLNVYVHKQPSTLKAQSVSVQLIECFYAEEVPVNVTPLNGELKNGLNEMRESINFLKE